MSSFISIRHNITLFSRFTVALLCGLNGFTIFLEPNWIDEIVSWQNKITGCYEYFGIDDDNQQEPQQTCKQQRQRARNRRRRHVQEPEQQISNNRIRPPRSVQQLDDKCSDHMSGLAAAAFGLFANIIQNA